TGHFGTRLQKPKRLYLKIVEIKRAHPALLGREALFEPAKSPNYLFAVAPRDYVHERLNQSSAEVFLPDQLVERRDAAREPVGSSWSAFAKGSDLLNHGRERGFDRVGVVVDLIEQLGQRRPATHGLGLHSGRGRSQSAHADELVHSIFELTQQRRVA